MSNTLVPQNNNTGVDIKTINTVLVADMMGKRHADVLLMLEGQKDKNGKTKIVGIIPTIEQSGELQLADYFIKSTYNDRGRMMKCYECTKMGCDMLANKMTGEKGILFTARYVKKFNEMEQTIDQQTQMINKQYEDRLDRLESMVTTMVKSFTEVVEKLATTTKVIEQPKSEQISFINTPLRTPYTATKIGKLINRKPEIINQVASRYGIITKTNNGWVLNKKYEEAGYGKTCKGGQYEGTFVRYSEKGKQEIIKIFK